MFSISTEKQKRFARTFLTVLLTFLVPVVVVVILLLTVPKARHGAFSFALELPGYATNFMLQQYVPIRRFDKAIPWLERELSLVEWFASPRNRLLPGLIKNTEYAVGRARFPEEFAVLRPYLVKLVDTHPNLYPARIWLARALANVDPSATFEQLESAAKLSSADDRPFRIAISVALKNQLPEKLKEWCDKYEKSQFGGIESDLVRSRFQAGIGLRIFVLEVIDESSARQFSASMGLRLGETVTYEFTLEKKVFVKELQLHLGIVPGISVVLEKLQMYAGGRKGAVFLGKDLVLSSWSGFHLDDGRILTVSRDGEMISILPSKEGFGEVDRIEATVGFKRLGVASPSPCGEKRTS
jgi:hypothetical protein